MCYDRRTRLTLRRLLSKLCWRDGHGGQSMLQLKGQDRTDCSDVSQDSRAGRCCATRGQLPGSLDHVVVKAPQQIHRHKVISPTNKAAFRQRCDARLTRCVKYLL